MQIVVASHNPVKQEAVQRGFSRVFPDEPIIIAGVDVASGVDDQPIGDTITLQGANNRVDNAYTAQPQAAYWVGIEGGVEDNGDSLMAFAWVVIASAERRGRARTGTFILPDEVAQLVRQGHELGHADDMVFGRSNSKQQNGSVGILTGDLINRADFYTEAVILALIPFINTELTFR